MSQQSVQFLKARAFRVARMAERHVDKFNVQNLANTAWAFATVGQKNEQLFKVLAKMAERRLDEFNAQ